MAKLVNFHFQNNYCVRARLMKSHLGFDVFCPRNIILSNNNIKKVKNAATLTDDGIEIYGTTHSQYQLPNYAKRFGVLCAVYGIANGHNISPSLVKTYDENSKSMPIDSAYLRLNLNLDENEAKLEKELVNNFISYLRQENPVLMEPTLVNIFRGV